MYNRIVRLPNRMFGRRLYPKASHSSKKSVSFYDHNASQHELPDKDSSLTRKFISINKESQWDNGLEESPRPIKRIGSPRIHRVIS